jgi:hypothetical protein
VIVASLLYYNGKLYKHIRRYYNANVEPNEGAMWHKNITIHVLKDKASSQYESYQEQKVSIYYTNKNFYHGN